MHVVIGGVDRPVQIEYKRIRGIYLRVNPDGSLRVSSPRFVTRKEIEAFLYSREDWILSTTLKQQAKASIHKEGVGGPEIYWLGNKKYVRYEASKKNWVFLDGDILTFYLKDFSEETIIRTFRKFASEQLMNEIQVLRETWDREICEANGLPIPTISTRYMTSRWGVCTPSKAHITMSIRLMHYPLEALEYVLLHEYAHFLVPNHSKRFYAVIAHYMPQYKEYSNQLK